MQKKLLRKHWKLLDKKINNIETSEFAPEETSHSEVECFNKKQDP